MVDDEKKLEQRKKPDMTDWDRPGVRRVYLSKSENAEEEK